MFALLNEPTQDPILSITSAFREDFRPSKLDLGIGLYRDDKGETPIMAAVRQAQIQQSQYQTSKSYMNLAGNEGFNQSMITLLLGNTDASTRTQAVQTPGASGALRLLAELIKLAKPHSRIWLSDPSYVNHQPIMQAAGLEVIFYPYFDRDSKQVDTAAMFSALEKAGPDDVVLLHGCCHNPTGADLTLPQWHQLTEMANAQGFMPFVDIAYQGFGQGLVEDAAGLQLMANSVEQMVIATSCSKSFGLYRERVGAALVVGKTTNEANKAKGQLVQLARTSYSMAPDHGADLVSTILADETLTRLWQDELSAMCDRLRHLRRGLSQSLQVHSNSHEFDYIEGHQGMFSATCFTAPQVEQLRQQFGIYTLGDGRINIAGLAEHQIDYLAGAMAAVQRRFE
jgi:aspartate aminotransferase